MAVISGGVTIADVTDGLNIESSLSPQAITFAANNDGTTASQPTTVNVTVIENNTSFTYEAGAVLGGNEFHVTGITTGGSIGVTNNNDGTLTVNNPSDSSSSGSFSVSIAYRDTGNILYSRTLRCTWSKSTAGAQGTGITGFVEYSNNNLFTQSPNSCVWSPAPSSGVIISDIDVTFSESGTDLAREAIRVTYTTSQELIQTGATTHPDGDLNADRITQTVQSNSDSVTVTFTYNHNGETAVVTGTIVAIPAAPKSDTKTLYYTTLSTSAPSDPDLSSATYNFSTRRFSSLPSTVSNDPQELAQGTTTQSVYQIDVTVVEGFCGDTTPTITFNDPYRVTVFGNNIQSDNFVTNVSGWQIQRDTGNAEFDNVIIRGDSTVDSSTIGGEGLLPIQLMLSGSGAAPGDPAGNLFAWELLTNSERLEVPTSTASSIRLRANNFTVAPTDYFDDLVMSITIDMTSQTGAVINSFSSITEGTIVSTVSRTFSKAAGDDFFTDTDGTQYPITNPGDISNVVITGSEIWTFGFLTTDFLSGFPASALSEDNVILGKVTSTVTTESGGTANLVFPSFEISNLNTIFNQITNTRSLLASPSSDQYAMTAVGGKKVNLIPSLEYSGSTSSGATLSISLINTSATLAYAQVTWDTTSAAIASTLDRDAVSKSAIVPFIISPMNVSPLNFPWNDTTNAFATAAEIANAISTTTDLLSASNLVDVSDSLGNPVTSLQGVYAAGEFVFAAGTVNYTYRLNLNNENQHSSITNVRLRNVWVIGSLGDFG